MRRLPTIILSLFIAAVMAGITVAIGVVAADMGASDSDAVERLRFMTGEFFGASYAPTIALGLSCAGILLAEIMRIRTPLYYLVAGAVIGFASSYGVDLSSALENTTDIAPVSFARTISAFAGGLGGLIYWLIAVRRRRRGPLSDSNTQ